MTDKEKDEARFKAQEIKNNLKQYNIPEPSDREAIAKDFAMMMINDLNEWGVDDHLRGKRVEFWEEVERNI